MYKNIEVTLLGIGALEIDSKVLNNFGLELNYNITDISNVGSRTSNYSKSFKIIGSANNNKVLEHAYDINFTSMSYDLNASQRAILSYNKNILIDGYLKIRKIEKTYIAGNYQIVYTVNIYDKIKDLFNTFDEKNLQELDFSTSYTMGNDIYNIGNHIFSWDTIETIFDSANYGSRTNIDVYDYGIFNYNYNGLNKGLKYPFNGTNGSFTFSSSDNTNGSGSIIGLSTMYPSVYVKAVFDKIMVESGYTYTSDFLNGLTIGVNSEEFKKLLTIYSGEEMLMNEQEVFYGISRYRDIVFSNSNIITEEPDDKDYIVNNLLFRVKKQAERIFNTIDSYTFTAQGTGDYELTLNINVISDSSVEDYTSAIVLIVNGEIEEEYPIGDFILGQDNTLISNISLNANDKVKYGVKVGFEADFSGATTLISEYNNTIKCYYENMPNRENEVLNLADYLPDMTQGKFIKVILEMFNLFIEVDSLDNNSLLIEPRDIYLTGEILDWNDKVNYDKNISIEPTYKKIRSSYEFELKTVDTLTNIDYFNRNEVEYGNYTLDIENSESTKVNKLKIDLDAYGNSTNKLPSVFNKTLSLGNTIIEREDGLCTYKRKNNMMFGFINDVIPGSGSSGDSIEDGLYYYRFCPYKPEEKDTSINVTTASFDTIKTITHFNPNYDLYFNTIGIERASAFDLYYEKEIININDNNNRIITYYVNLNYEDIMKIDFRRPILINEELFYLQNIVTDIFDPRNTKIKLIKAFDYAKYISVFINDFISGTYFVPSIALPAGVGRPYASETLLDSGIKSQINTINPIILNNFNGVVGDEESYIWFATPADVYGNIRNNWFMDANNNGKIGGDVDLGGNWFPDPELFNYNGVDYYVYIANYQTSTYRAFGAPGTPGDDFFIPASITISN